MCVCVCGRRKNIHEIVLYYVQLELAAMQLELAAMQLTMARRANYNSDLKVGGVMGSHDESDGQAR
jgi:hypothetical protein